MRNLAMVAAIVGIAVAGFVLLEVATRLFGPDDLCRQTYDAGMLDRRGGQFLYVNRAGYHGVFRASRVDINSQHLRGPELKADGRPRLMLLGDSVLFAHCVAYDDTPGPVLERLLNGKYAVINASCIGYSSEHELAFLKEFGPGLHPDMVVLGYCLNDPMSPNATSLAGVASVKSIKWAGWLFRLNMVLRKHSLFFVWLKAALHVEGRQNGYAAAIEPLFGAESWGRNRQVLLDIHAWCRERNIPFLLAIFPQRDQSELGEESMRPQRLLHELSDEFPVIDLTGTVTREDFLYADTLHLDARGIRKCMAVIARAIDNPGAQSAP